MHSLIAKRSLRFELLEDRRMLAGNVSVSRTGSVLNIIGDSSSNAVAITSTPDGAVTVTGLATPDGATTINTQPGAPPEQTFFAVYAGYVGNIIVNMSGAGPASRGNDVVVIAGLSFNGSISLRMSGGNDFVGLGDFDNSAQLVDSAVDTLLGPLVVHQGISIDLGAGDNQVLARDVVTNGPNGPNFAIVAAGGANAVSLSNVTVDHALSLTTNGATIVDVNHLTALNATFTLGTGDDQLTLDNSVIRNDLTIRTQTGNDQISFDTDTFTALNIITGAGDDQVSMNSVKVLKLATLDLGAGDDTATFDLDTFQGLNILGGAGNDTFSFGAQPAIDGDNVTAGALSINAGAGDDSITLDHLWAYVLSVSAGDGADSISSKFLDILGSSATVAGGAGNDIVTFDGVRSDVSGAQLLIGLGLGDDQCTLHNIDISSLQVGGGNGNDTITLGIPTSASDTLNRVNVQSLAITLGNGNDHLSMQDTSSSLSAVLGGGLGSDTFTNLGGNALTGLVYKNIELPATVDDQSGFAEDLSGASSGVVTLSSSSGTIAGSGTLILAGNGNYSSGS